MPKNEWIQCMFSWSAAQIEPKFCTDMWFYVGSTVGLIYEMSLSGTQIYYTMLASRKSGSRMIYVLSINKNYTESKD